MDVFSHGEAYNIQTKKDKKKGEEKEEDSLKKITIDNE